MKYSELQKLLPVEELHYVDDCEVFFNENPSLYDKDYQYILFEYTISCFPEVIKTLKENNIEYLTKTDKLGLDIILIK